MKTQAHRIEDLQRSRFEADLEAGINALFCRCPALCGFTVRDAANLSRDGLALQHVSELFVTEVSLYPLSGPAAPGELCGEIVAALVELLDECPEARELLRERTFARVFH
jgi:hypothetical protein